MKRIPTKKIDEMNFSDNKTPDRKSTLKKKITEIENIISYNFLLMLLSIHNNNKIVIINQKQ